MAGLDPEGLFTGWGGGTLSRRLEPSGASCEQGDSMGGWWNPRSLKGGPVELPGIFFKNLCL